MPKFKVGDVLKSKMGNRVYEILFVGEERYFLKIQNQGECSRPINSIDMCCSLYIPPRTLKKWVNIYVQSDGTLDCGILFSTEEEAKRSGVCSGDYKDTIEISYTEKE